MTDVQGHCPACGGASLFLADGGHVTCSRIDCPAPDAAADMLGHGAPMLHRVAALASELFMAGAPGPERETARKFLAVLQRKEPRLMDCGFCYEEQGEEVHPHPECPRGAVCLPVVKIAGALSERLDEIPGKPIVFAGGRGAHLCIDGREYAVSSEHAVTVDRFEGDTPGGLLTLTLIADQIIIDGKEVGDV